ncbi:hypothetical protein BCV72DRAFT_307936 [Rhizopus microsporus var. microsporus]|uniref:Integrase catalytic domain-containing protein n=2 Tax=Rhizopus microsporus TaxID=58291 RepID=A0A2G4T0I7_RHIZD|nr:uncharacterized protein RHIMIDRAFT_235308 [Rhizopus microsporus ATCC 52813]ORE03766.1 hypothetical protein BCV72DRAFT_307936 [Rhizopus microsporus var. microsporus]PHZ14532.1 hypothetical protein RHIMIDRAFT_235308 [Rhizopus microsporus ATCC 52813]
MTNWSIACAVPEATAEAVADFLYEEIVMRFDYPNEFYTDRGASFLSKIRKHRSAGFSPLYLMYCCEPRLPGDELRPYLATRLAQDPRTIAEFTARERELLGQVRAAAQKRMEAVFKGDKRKWNAWVTMSGLEYSWMGPFTVAAKNDVTNIYKLVSVGGEPYLSYVHIDRLKEVKVEYINTLWYNPTVSHAVCRAGVGHSAPTTDSLATSDTSLSAPTVRVTPSAGSARVD